MQLLIAAVLIEAALVCLINMAGSVVESILLLLLIQPVYLYAVYRVFHGDNGKQPLIISAALVFRITVAPLPAPFSDDLNRYRWEARASLAGWNPYDVRPADPRAANLRDETYKNIPGVDFKAVYGPAWQLVCSTTFRLIRHWVATPDVQLLWLKLPAALFDLASIGALLALLRVRGLPDSRVLVYAWSPTAIWEFWGNGHNDAMVIFFVVAAIAALLKSPRGWHSGLLLGAAIATKWWPAILLPVFTKRSRGLRVLFAAAGALGLLAVPFLTNVTENAQFMTGFVGGWRNNDSLYGPLLYLMGDLYRAKYLAFALIGAITLWLASRPWPIERIAIWTIVTLLFLSANVHPWYLTWLIPFLAIYPHPSLLLWLAIAPIAYQVEIGWKILSVWEGASYVRWYIYAPVFATMVWELLQLRMRNKGLKPLMVTT